MTRNDIKDPLVQIAYDVYAEYCGRQRRHERLDAIDKQLKLLTDEKEKIMIDLMEMEQSVAEYRRIYANYIASNIIEANHDVLAALAWKDGTNDAR